MPRIPRAWSPHIPRAWRRQMDLLEEIDRRLRNMLDRPRLEIPMALAEIEAVLELIDTTLVREGRRPPPQP
jgi:hypothetical protein